MLRDLLFKDVLDRYFDIIYTMLLPLIGEIRHKNRNVVVQQLQSTLAYLSLLFDLLFQGNKLM